METVIAFLEQMGQNASLRHATQDQLRTALDATALTPEARDAIISYGGRDLEVAVGATPNTCCIIYASDLEVLVGATPNTCCLIEAVEVDHGDAPAISVEARDDLIARDGRRLEELIGAERNTCCIILASEE